MSGAGSPERPIEPPSPPVPRGTTAARRRRVCVLCSFVLGALKGSDSFAFRVLCLSGFGWLGCIDYCDFVVSLLDSFLVSWFLGYLVVWLVDISHIRYADILPL